MCVCVCVCVRDQEGRRGSEEAVPGPSVFPSGLSCVWLFATPWTAAHQASLSITIQGDSCQVRATGGEGLQAALGGADLQEGSNDEQGLNAAALAGQACICLLD